jgi:subtilisin family serine protease
MRWALLVALLLALAGCASAPTAPAGADADMQARSDRFVVVAVANPLQRLPSRAGTSLSSYGGTPRYTQGEQAARVLADVARRHQLREAAAWPIPALGVHCVVFEIAPDASRDAVLAALAQDAQVQLGQPLHDFEPLATDAPGVRYDDPYLPLQQGFLALGVPQAHRLSTGRGVHVAVIDTGAQTDHPDLNGRAIALHNLVDERPAAALAERHGTEVLGLIAATGNNGQGIVGIAPDARLSLYRACWYGAANGRARCNSFTLAKALVAVLASDARVINLSLGGPDDPLLTQLLQQLLRQGRSVVAALPADGLRRGFPAGVPGVIAVAATGQADGAAPLQAPGRDVLTLQPGGRYDFASGSSMAAAQVSGVVALMLSAQPALDGPAIEGLLAGAEGRPWTAQQLLAIARTGPARLARR